MRGRIIGIKKTTILRSSFFFAAVAIIASALLSALLFKSDTLWFYFFCLFVGLHLVIKSGLFRLDSSCYFGFLLLATGAMGIWMHFLSQYRFASVYFILAAAFASFSTFCFYSQKFQLYLSILLFFVDAAWLLYKINLFKIWFFLAILIVGVVLFVLEYFITHKRIKRS